ncbi:MAG: M56 family metallopeptidase, partial [Litorimonas sp.]
LPALRTVWPGMAIPSEWVPDRFRPASPEPLPVFLEPAPFAIEATPALPAPVATNALELLASALPALWLTGVLAGGTWILFRHLRHATYLNRTTIEPDAGLRTEADRAARIAGLSRAPTVRVSLFGEGPSVTGLLRPVIVLPEAFEETFTPEQRRLALVHEMSHVRRGDLWSAAAMLAVRLLNWPNPLVHLAWSAFRADQEAACDATVLRRVGETERASYAETLLTAAKHSGRASPAIGAGLSLSLHHPVKERLMTLGTKTKCHGLARAGLATLLLGGAAMTAPLSLADDPEKAEVEKSISIVVDRLESADLSDLSELSERIEGRTFVFTNRDGTTGSLSLDELIEQYGDDLPSDFAERLAGEPGLRALQGDGERRFGSVTVKHTLNNEDGHFELRSENGEVKAFRIEEDGTRVEVDPDSVDHLERLQGLDGLAALRLKRLGLDGEDGKTSFRFSEGDFPGTFFFNSSGANGVQLRTAESMIESTARRIEQLRESDEGRSDRDLREAERELKKAQAALEKAQAAMQRREAE